MAYRAPVRISGMRPRGARSIETPSVFDVANGMSALAQIMAQLEALKASHAQSMADLIAEAKQQIAGEITRIRAIKQGDMGPLPLKGVHYDVPTLDEIMGQVAPLIPQVENGKDADEAAITQRVITHVSRTLKEQIATPEEVADVVLSMIVVPKGDKGDSPEASTIIEQLVQRIKDEKLLKPEHIDGLPSTLQTLKNNGGGVMRGGGDTVLAGTNVTITRNSGGRKVISATSGGFTTLTATETPNGNTLVFTFAAATAQPSALIVDNAWQRATTKAGTVNWTWNAGTKKATLAVAPADEILGIV